jgi:hypothetical protein
MSKHLKDTEYTATNPPKKKANAKEDASWFVTLCDLASRGISDKSIATRLGITLAQFQQLCDYEYPTGVYKVREALDLARAEYEISRVEMKDAILNDAETSAGLKIKIIRDDLKTLEAWAPATRTVKVQVENVASEFSFEAFSDDEQQKIIAAAVQGDIAIENNNDNDTNDNSEE